MTDYSAEQVDNLIGAIDKLAKAREESQPNAKGADDNCPHCAAAFSVSQATLRNDCVMVFTRSEGLRDRTSSLSAAAKKGSLAVTFLIPTICSASSSTMRSTSSMG